MVQQSVGFFAMLRGFYSALFTLSNAVNTTAKAVDNLATWADEQTATFVDEARDERALKAAVRKQQFAKELESLKAQGIPVTDVTPKAIS